MDKRVVELLTPRSTIRRNATIIQAAGKKYERPYKKTGITSGWVGETTARTATDAQTYDMISAEVGELYAFPQYTQNFLADTWYNFEEGLKTIHREIGTSCRRLILNPQPELL